MVWDCDRAQSERPARRADASHLTRRGRYSETKEKSCTASALRWGPSPLLPFPVGLGRSPVLLLNRSEPPYAMVRNTRLPFRQEMVYRSIPGNSTINRIWRKRGSLEKLNSVRDGSWRQSAAWDRTLCMFERLAAGRQGGYGRSGGEGSRAEGPHRSAGAVSNSNFCPTCATAPSEVGSVRPSRRPHPRACHILPATVEKIQDRREKNGMASIRRKVTSSGRR